MLSVESVLDALRSHFIIDEKDGWSTDRQLHELTWTPDGGREMRLINDFRSPGTLRYVEELDTSTS